MAHVSCGFFTMTVVDVSLELSWNLVQLVRTVRTRNACIQIVFPVMSRVVGQGKLVGKLLEANRARILTEFIGDVSCLMIDHVFSCQQRFAASHAREHVWVLMPHDVILHIAGRLNFTSAASNESVHIVLSVVLFGIKPAGNVLEAKFALHFSVLSHQLLVVFCKFS